MGPFALDIALGGRSGYDSDECPKGTPRGDSFCPTEFYYGGSLFFFCFFLVLFEVSMNLVNIP